MQRQIPAEASRRRRLTARVPSNMSVRISNDPPPPPRLPPPELAGGGGEGGGEVGVPGVTPDVTGVAQAVSPADAGAADVVRVGSTTTSVASTRPRSSMTVTRSVIDPELGAMTVAAAVFAPTIAGGLIVGETTVQAYEETFRPQAAALAAALRLTFWPADTDAGREMAAIGRAAANTELVASTMPAPQTSLVQRHCSVWMSLVSMGVWQVRMFWASETTVGNGRAPSRRRASIWFVDKLLFRESISAAIPEMIGAEKLVPRLKLA